MSDDHIWDVIVVGAGVVGSWTAYHAAKSGKKTLLLEQFGLPHTRGSSLGHSRLIRMIYDKEEYAVLMPEAYKLWQQLEAESGYTFFKKTGLLWVDVGEPEENRKHQHMKYMMDKFQRTYEILHQKEMNQRYSMLNFPSDAYAMYEPNSGILVPDKCLLALQETIKKYGGVIHDEEKVKAIHPGQPVSIVTSKQCYLGKSVVLTPGSWASDVLNIVGLKVPLKTMPGWPAYWTYDQKAVPRDLPESLPIIHYNMKLEDGYRFMLLTPEYEYPGLIKVASRGEPPPCYLHPDRQADDDKMSVIKSISDFIKENLKHVHTQPAIIEPCMYTVTPDKGYIVDRHPKYHNIIIGAGFSGHGFKSSPMTGKLLLQLASGEVPSYPVDKFKITRFNSTLTAKL